MGPDLIVCAYNDAYLPLLGQKSQLLGRRFLDVWAEARDSIEPALQDALNGRASNFSDAKFTLLRKGHPETAFFDYSFSPVRDASGAVFAVLNTAVEKNGRGSR